MKRHLLAATLTILAGGLSAAQAATYRAVQQFSQSNPSGAWAYGTGTTGSSFTPFPYYTSNWNGLGDVDAWVTDAFVPFLAVNETDGSYIDRSFLVPTNILVMYPSATADSILQWTAPQAGTYSFSGLYEILDRTPSGIAAKIFDNSTDITTTAFGGNSGILTGPGANLKTFTPGGKEKFSFKLTVTQGEIISFGLNSDGSATFDATGVNVTVHSVSP
jgi:hypothetical protein